jgi:hypothetical protein
VVRSDTAGSGHRTEVVLAREHIRQGRVVLLDEGGVHPPAESLPVEFSSIDDSGRVEQFDFPPLPAVLHDGDTLDRPDAGVVWRQDGNQIRRRAWFCPHVEHVVVCHTDHTMCRIGESFIRDHSRGRGHLLCEGGGGRVRNGGGGVGDGGGDHLVGLGTGEQSSDADDSDHHQHCTRAGEGRNPRPPFGRRAGEPLQGVLGIDGLGALSKVVECLAQAVVGAHRSCPSKSFARVVRARWRWTRAVADAQPRMSAISSTGRSSR